MVKGWLVGQVTSFLFGKENILQAVKLQMNIWINVSFYFLTPSGLVPYWVKAAESSDWLL